MASCGLSKGRQEAESVAERYFTAMDAGDIPGALSLYSARFYQVTSRAEWLQWLSDLRARCGPPRSHSLSSWKVMSTIGTNGGMRATLVYDVQYSSCRMSESFTIFKPTGGKTQVDAHLQKTDSPNPEGKDRTATSV
jgi:hypothetical protein